MVDSAVERYLDRVYNCRIKKVGTHMSTVKVKRKEKLGVRRKILGIFPVYDYKEWEDYLADWKPVSLEQYSGVARIPNTDIAVIVDEFNNVVYWKYV